MSKPQGARRTDSYSLVGHSKRTGQVDTPMPFSNPLKSAAGRCTHSGQKGGIIRRAHLEYERINEPDRKTHRAPASHR